jgi:cbb3-type cytochrome oxidase subunit 3
VEVTGLPAWFIAVFIALLFGGLWFAFPLARRPR